MSNFVTNEVVMFLTWNFWNFILFNSFIMQGNKEHDEVGDDPNDDYTNCEIDVEGDDTEREFLIY